ncbi:ArsR family transcriptional regulator [Halomonas sp. ISL-60]|uniref:ArsR/SmtB family transcription factor n=1 Tax=Halomonas sp. ISL-56 TaxID=2819149 RepID=UPI001BE5E3EB|nr:ArsR family transcriptional regulator [Halomonas sp. ISL-56]MBT2774046.1 ArsR family transcriptional regulator [Halomonas sp. ISL-60]MBT2802483.1 ArsR family transcriptional regulator [Halomonas sp. ISL-56]
MPDESGHPTVDEMRLGAVLSALAEQKRRYVVREFLKMEKGAECHCSAFKLKLSKAATSHHFRVLREAGLIWQTDLGNRSVAHLRYEEVEHRFPGLLALVLKEAE